MIACAMLISLTGKNGKNEHTDKQNNAYHCDILFVSHFSFDSSDQLRSKNSFSSFFQKFEVLVNININITVLYRLKNWFWWNFNLQYISCYYCTTFLCDTTLHYTTLSKANLANNNIYLPQRTYDFQDTTSPPDNNTKYSKTNNQPWYCVSDTYWEL